MVDECFIVIAGGEISFQQREAAVAEIHTGEQEETN